MQCHNKAQTDEAHTQMYKLEIFYFLKTNLPRKSVINISIPGWGGIKQRSMLLCFLVSCISCEQQNYMNQRLAVSFQGGAGVIHE